MIPPRPGYRCQGGSKRSCLSPSEGSFSSHEIRACKGHRQHWLPKTRRETVQTQEHAAFRSPAILEPGLLSGSDPPRATLLWPAEPRIRILQQHCKARKFARNQWFRTRCHSLLPVWVNKPGNASQKSRPDKNRLMTFARMKRPCHQEFSAGGRSALYEMKK